MQAAHHKPMAPSALRRAGLFCPLPALARTRDGKHGGARSALSAEKSAPAECFSDVARRFKSPLDGGRQVRTLTFAGAKQLFPAHRTAPRSGNRSQQQIKPVTGALVGKTPPELLLAGLVRPGLALAYCGGVDRGNTHRLVLVFQIGLCRCRSLRGWVCCSSRHCLRPNRYVLISVHFDWDLRKANSNLQVLRRNAWLTTIHDALLKEGLPVKRHDSLLRGLTI